MKIILKGGNPEKNEEIKTFFMEKIFPILTFGIAFEPSDDVITVHEKQKDHTVKTYIDPTAEVIVELTEEAKNLAIDPDTATDILREKSGKFFDEALAIKELEKLKQPCSVEYYSCRYKHQS